MKFEMGKIHRVFSNVNRDAVFIAAVFILSGFFLLLRLGDAYLWQDEAQTALISKTITQHGLPYGTDGKNFFSQELGAEYGENYIWKWHTWLPFYLVAGSFEIFGVNTFAARLPFALCGIGTILLIFFCCRELWEDRTTAYAASILLVSSVPFLILSRQCRYYSMAALLSLASLYFYQRILLHKRFAVLAFIACVTLLFHTLYLYCATLLAAVAVHVLIFHRGKWRKVFLACTSAVVLCSPWIFWLGGMRYGEQYGDEMFDPTMILHKAQEFFIQIHRHILPASVLIVFSIGLALRFKAKELFPKGWRGELSTFSLLLLFVVITLAALCFSAPAPFFRYLAPLVPPIIMIAARCTGIGFRVHPVMAGIMMVLILLSNPFTRFLGEITHDYNGPIEAIVEFLQEKASPRDTVAITYGDLPLKFYTDLRIVGGLTGEDLEPALDARWIILRKHIICSKDRAVGQFLEERLAAKRFQRFELPAFDIPFENRESPEEHRFRSATSGSPVVILEKLP